MRKLLLDSLVVIPLLTLAVLAQPNSWRGLIPLRSTKSDVEKLLGKPIGSNYPFSKTYEFESGKVYVHYSDGKCLDGWNVTENTVIDFHIYDWSLMAKTAQDLNLNEKDYFVKNTDIPEPTWIDPVAGRSFHFRQGLENERIGFVLDSISYMPTRSDKDKRCSGFPPFAPERNYFTMDTWPFLDPREAKNAFFVNVAQIDNTMIHLGHLGDNYTGYALIYFDKSRPFTFYKQQFEKLKGFINKRWASRAGKFIFIEAGFQQKSEIRLYIIPNDWPPPVPSPTLPSPQFR
jgi:hypothetical protein